VGLLRHLRDLSRHDPSLYVPFRADGERYGSVLRSQVPALAPFRDVFVASEEGVEIAPGLSDPADRTKALARVAVVLEAMGLVPRLRGEPYPVVRRFGEEPAANLDRAAVRFFGLRSFGVHVNGYVRERGETRLWVGKRAADRASCPGQWDHLVAGGQPAGLGLLENLVKEAHEEAGVPAGLAASALPVGTLSYRRDGAHGLHDDTLFVYDLEVPADFRPRNLDGEVEAFSLWSVPELLDSLRGGSSWKYNVSPVVLWFLLRHGLLPKDEPERAELVRLLRDRSREGEVETLGRERLTGSP
jgi:8-oxo-dGTP pyrophosphatase MutT (NUDIX family)